MSRFSRIISTACLLAALAPAAARADAFDIGFSETGLPGAGAGVSLITLPNSDVGISQGTISLGGSLTATLSVAGGQGVVVGTTALNYAEPVSGGTPASPTYYTDPYLSVGNSTYYNGTATLPSTITLSFGGQEKYLGALWGSIDVSNTVQFYSNGTLVGTITGQTVQTTTGSTAANGSQGFGGSYYTLLNDTTGTFDTAILTNNGSPSFEIANLQFSPNNVTVPEPPSLPLLAAGLALVWLAARRPQTRFNRRS